MGLKITKQHIYILYIFCANDIRFASSCGCKVKKAYAQISYLKTKFIIK